MEIQLSSGQGPAECELGVAKLLNALLEEFPDIKVLDKRNGRVVGCYRSVRISSETDLSFLEGSVLWICKSPYRPHHGRKNWFIDVSPCHVISVEHISSTSNNTNLKSNVGEAAFATRRAGVVDLRQARGAKTTKHTFDFKLVSDVRFETFRSGGKGGQHVNKVETGVRATHVPTGISAVSTDERSQHLNKQTALKRLLERIESGNAERKAAVKSEDRLEHTRIERGNPVRVYKDMEFRLIQDTNVTGDKH